MDLSLEGVRDLPERMRERQHLFRLTGGIHAAALFDLAGELLVLHEDIGRHNAGITASQVACDRVDVTGGSNFAQVGANGSFAPAEPELEGLRPQFSHVGERC